LWGGFCVGDAHFDLPQHHHDLRGRVSLDRHDQLFLRVDFLPFHRVQISPVTSAKTLSIQILGGEIAIPVAGGYQEAQDSTPRGGAAKSGRQNNGVRLNVDALSTCWPPA